MSSSKLKPNFENSDLILFGSKYQQNRLIAYFRLGILGNLTSFALLVWNLEVIFDSNFSFSHSFCLKVLVLCIWGTYGALDSTSLKKLSSWYQMFWLDAVLTIAMLSLETYCDLTSISCSAFRSLAMFTNRNRYVHVTPIFYGIGRSG